MSDSPETSLSAAIIAWIAYLGQERRLAAKTLEAYGRDVRQFHDFLSQRLGRAPGASDFAALKPADLRAFLAARRAEEIDARSLQRALSALRGLAKYLERIGAGRASAFSALRSPKAGRRLPRPLNVEDARAVADVETRAGETREPWILARDAAALALCYGAGLRISEALSIKRGDAPVGAVPSHDPHELVVYGHEPLPWRVLREVVRMVAPRVDRSAMYATDDYTLADADTLSVRAAPCEPFDLLPYALRPHVDATWPLTTYRIACHARGRDAAASSSAREQISRCASLLCDAVDGFVLDGDGFPLVASLTRDLSESLD